MPKSKHRKEQKAKSAKRGKLKAEFREKTRKMYSSMMSQQLNSQILSAQNAAKVVADAPTDDLLPDLAHEILPSDLLIPSETNDLHSFEPTPLD